VNDFFTPLIPIQKTRNNMDVKQAYDIWAAQYDTTINSTRDLEAISLRTTLADFQFDLCLEIGCGTGKNTEWLLQKAKQVLSVDLSDEMLSVARKKINSDKVRFLQADITREWDFTNQVFDLVTFSLVLEHIENLDDIFNKVSKATAPNGFVYVGELHPFKQYTGTKARFDTGDGQQIVPCFNHHVSDFIKSAKDHGFEIENLAEFFDGNDRTSVPRILTLILRKK
jgi:ubiquinone/menaquinone biosynthesis C-methylase UbiE